MANKDLKKLNRRQLLELLLLQTERADQLQQQLDEARAKLEERYVAILDSGTIADAALKLSGIFEAAQKTADIYLESIRRQAESESRQEAEAVAKAQAMIKTAERRCAEMERDADAYWAETQERIRKQCELINEIYGKGSNLK